jgi:hypothetical protein
LAKQDAQVTGAKGASSAGKQTAASTASASTTMTSFVRQLESFATQSLQSPGTRGAVSSRLAQIANVSKKRA